MFTPFKIRSHYSLSLNPSKNILLQSLNRPNAIAEACALRKYSSFGLSDIGTVSGSVAVMKACKSVCECGKQKDEHFEGKGRCRYKNGCEEYRPYKLKPIIGSDFFIATKDDAEKAVINGNLSVVATNFDGWKNLMRLTSLANSPSKYTAKPTLSLEDFDKSGLVCITGQSHTPLANSLFTDPSLAYACKDYECVKALIKADWEQSTNTLLDKLLNLFGRENLYLEVNLQDPTFPASILLSRTMRYLAKKAGLKVLASTNCFYPNKTDSSDHRLIVCSSIESTLSDVSSKLERNESLDAQNKFFKSNNYYLPTPEEVQSLYLPGELTNSLELAERCETYNIFNRPQIPAFSDEDGDTLLHTLCKKGWKDNFAGKIPKDEWRVYGDRIKMELETFKEAGLANYFLIVQDYCRYAKEELKALMSPSRGSCGGSMVACLLGIIDKRMDPVANGLFFERFYNAGRNTKDKVSLPDIDSDFPTRYRPQVIEYVRKKYGYDKVSQMCTFGKLQGKGAVKEVLRVHGVCSFDEMNKISKTIQDPSKISGDLQEKREEEGDASPILWSLENTPKALKDWVELKDGQLIGQFAKQFEQAIRIEGIYRSQGKHASGTIISSVVLSENLPMIHDKENTGLQVAGFEMGDLEAMGYVKFDILNLRMLDKLMDVQNLLFSEDGDLDD